MCRALQRAHECGIVHRDLKPDNVFLVRSPDEDEEIAKVLDFGVAKFTTNPGDQRLTSSTKTGAVLGTPYYMSPEQARGLRTIDWRTDLWSLGIIAYECVTGALPFDGESVGDLLVKSCTSPVPVPSEKVPELPPSSMLVVRALDREPANRFASATELADSLARAAGITPRSPMSSTAGAVADETHEANETGDRGPSHPAAITAAALTASTPSGHASWNIAAVIAVVALAGGGAGALAFVNAHRLSRVRAQPDHGAVVASPGDPVDTNAPAVGPAPSSAPSSPAPPPPIARPNNHRKDRPMAAWPPGRPPVLERLHVQPQKPSSRRHRRLPRTYATSHRPPQLPPALALHALADRRPTLGTDAL